MSMGSDSGYLLVARFSNCGNFIFAGGAGKNELKIFANNCDSSANFKILMEIRELPAAVMSMDAHPVEKYFTFGLENGCIYVVHYENDEESPDFEPYKGEFARVATKIVNK